MTPETCSCGRYIEQHRQQQGLITCSRCAKRQLLREIEEAKRKQRVEGLQRAMNKSKY